MRAYEETLAVFLLVLVASVVAVWSITIGEGNLPSVADNLFSLAFRWLSDLLLVVVGVLVAVGLLGKRHWSRRFGLFVLGVSICATFDSAYRYFLVQPVLFFAVMTSIFFVMSVLLLLLGFRAWWFSAETPINLSKLSLVVMGILVYYLLNLAGSHGQKGEWSSFATALFLIAAGMFFLAKIRIQPTS